MKLRTALYIFICITYVSTAWAVDEIRVAGPMSETDKRSLYKNSVLKLILDASIERYGEYKLITNGPIVTRARAVRLLKEGEVINLHISTGIEDFEFNSITIRANLRKSLASYRLLLIPISKQAQFTDVATVDDLKKFKAGAMQHSKTKKQLRLAGLDVEDGTDFDGLFQMLAGQRYDYIVRGINEIYYEMSSGLPAFENLMVAPDIAIYIPMSTYIFVTKNDPKLAERIIYGLNIIRSNGDFDKNFHNYYDESIRKSNLLNRKIISLNSNHPDIYKSSEIWRYLEQINNNNAETIASPQTHLAVE